MVTHTFNPSTREQRQVYHYESEARQSSIVRASFDVDDDDNNNEQ